MGDHKKFKISVERRKKAGDGYTYYVFDYDTQTDDVVCKQGEADMHDDINRQAAIEELIGSGIRAVPVSATHDTLKVLPFFKTENETSLRIDYGRTVTDLFIEGQMLHSNGADKMPVKAIFDTGAQSACVRASYAEKMGWQRVGHSVMGGVVGKTRVAIYRGSVALEFDNGQLSLKDLVAWGAPLPGEIDVLIGQPVIKRFGFDVAQGFSKVTLYFDGQKDKA